MEHNPQKSLKIAELSQLLADGAQLRKLPRDTLLDDIQTGVVLGDVATSTLAVWRCTGRYDLPFLKIGRNVRYRLGDVLDWMESRKRLHTGAK